MIARVRRGRRGAWWLLASFLAVATGPATAQVNNPAYANYFLVGEFGEVCTMCEVMVLCEASAAPPAHAGIPEQGTYTLYYLHTRTFWSQVSTIWEWFISNFTTKSLEAGHRRPVTIYNVNAGEWTPAMPGEVQVSLDPARLAFSDGREIDRRDRRWQASATGAQPLGYCQRLPLWDAVEVLEARTGSSPSGEHS
jgi:hypothetical protein